MKDSDQYRSINEPDDPLSTEAGTVLPLPDMNTVNEFLLGMAGNVITPQFHPRFTTRQQAYRFAAWCQTMGEVLPDEPGGQTFEQIRNAIRNT